MALSRLASMPIELKIETYYHFHYTDLLAVSHVSQFWRSLALKDVRWNVWFDMIIDPKSDVPVRDSLARLEVSDTISKRAIVTLCFTTKCTVCFRDTASIFLPLLQRVCTDCISKPTLAVISLSAALTAYDLREQDLANLVILQWKDQRPKNVFPCTQVKLVSESAIKTIAAKKHGGEEALAQHLEARKARLLIAYGKRIAEFETAYEQRKKLRAKGDLAAAAGITLQSGKPLPKTRPQKPPALKSTFAPLEYRTLSAIRTTFLVFDAEAGFIVPRKLVDCRLCEIMNELREEELEYVGGLAHFGRPMWEEQLSTHEKVVHYACRDDPCQRPLEGGDGTCTACLNNIAISIKVVEDLLGHSPT